MPGAEEEYRTIRREAPSFADYLRTAAAASHNEAELRTQVAHRSQGLADRPGVPRREKMEHPTRDTHHPLPVTRYP